MWWRGEELFGIITGMWCTLTAVGRITRSTSDGGVVREWRGETKCEINRTEGLGGMVGDMQEEYSVPLSQLLSFNLLTAISCFIGKRVLCVSMPPPTIAGSKKKKKKLVGSGGGGIWLFCYFLCMWCYIRRKFRSIMWQLFTLQPLPILCGGGGGGGWGERVIMLFLSSVRGCNLVLPFRSLYGPSYVLSIVGDPIVLRVLCGVVMWRLYVFFSCV